MADKKIINFPIPKTHLKFIRESAARTQMFIETLNLTCEKEVLNKNTFLYLLNYLQLDLYRDFTTSDLAIIKFHCENYYNLRLDIW